MSFDPVMQERLTRLSNPVNIYHMQTDRCPPPEEATEYHDRETLPEMPVAEAMQLIGEQQETIARLQRELIIWRGR